MSRTVDERVVSMQFDNKQFESGVKTSMSTLDRLKSSLNFDGVSKGFSAVGDWFQKFSFRGIEEGVDKLSQKFSALGVVAMTVVQNLTNAVVNSARQMAEALAIAPIGEGYSDYEKKLTSIQTISAATGKSVEDIDPYFRELDTYADKTIYNLSDMTGALAKFTNAGIELDTAIPAIKGIANMTALAGQDAAAAAVAFYNMPQSLSAGFLQTIDYRSLNLVNVATVEWKQH